MLITKTEGDKLNKSHFADFFEEFRKSLHSSKNSFIFSSRIYSKLKAKVNVQPLPRLNASGTRAFIASIKRKRIANEERHRNSQIH